MRVTVALAVCVAAWGVSPASERPETVPVEISAVRSDLVVVGTVDAVGEPEKMQVAPPPSTQPAEGVYRKCRLRVKAVLKDAAAEAERVKPEQIISFLARVAKDGGRPKPPALLAEGASCVLLLRRLAGREELYLPDRPSCRHPADPEAIYRVREAAQTDAWRWGKAVDGLQIALASIPRAYPLTMEVRRRRGHDGRWRAKMVRPMVRLRPVVAVRNVSDKPRSLSMHPGDWSLSVEGVGSGGGKISQEIFRPPYRPPAFDPAAIQVLQPGQIRFIAQGGMVDESMPLYLRLADGQWSLKAVFVANRGQARGADGTATKL
ncbi:MAG: hypothetical protein ACYS5V_15405, partial [Planctomycetota bacterium]